MLHDDKDFWLMSISDDLSWPHHCPLIFDDQNGKSSVRDCWMQPLPLQCTKVVGYPPCKACVPSKADNQLRGCIDKFYHNTSNAFVPYCMTAITRIWYYSRVYLFHSNQLEVTVPSFSLRVPILFEPDSAFSMYRIHSSYAFLSQDVPHWTSDLCTWDTPFEARSRTQLGCIKRVLLPPSAPPKLSIHHNLKQNSSNSTNNPLHRYGLFPKRHLLYRWSSHRTK